MAAARDSCRAGSSATRLPGQGRRRGDDPPVLRIPPPDLWRPEARLHHHQAAIRAELDERLSRKRRRQRLAGRDLPHPDQLPSRGDHRGAVGRERDPVDRHFVIQYCPQRLAIARLVEAGERSRRDGQKATIRRGPDARRGSRPSGSVAGCHLVRPLDSGRRHHEPAVRAEPGLSQHVVEPGK